MKHLFWRAYLGSSLMLTSLMVHSATSARVDVTVKVDVLVPPCTVHGGIPIDVDFRTIPTTQVDGIQHKQPVPYDLECSTTGVAVKMKVTGTPVTFSSSALQTNITGLGIGLQFNGVPLEIDQWVNFNYSAGANPLLEAVPVKASASSPLPEGVFTTTGATLVVDYQ